MNLFTRRIMRLGCIPAVVACTAAPIAASAAEDGERILHKEVVVPASIDAVWRAWTTSEGMGEFWVENAVIELRPMGRLELFMVPDAPEGQRGTEGCRVLSYVPGEMLAFEWNFPPSIPTLRDANAKTQVVLRFEELESGKVRVLFDQLGWGTGEDWDKGYAYFDRAWGFVLNLLKSHFEGKAKRTETWVDGAVTVTAEYGPIKRHVYAVDLPVDVATAWRTMTTEEGVRSFLSPGPVVDLVIGGPYALFPGSTQRVQAFVPERLLVVTGSAPLEFPNVRMGGTWAVIAFESKGPSSCRVQMTCAGWQEGEEWDRAFDYFLKNNPVFLNLLRQRFTEGPLRWSTDGDGPPTYERVKEGA